MKTFPPSIRKSIAEISVALDALCARTHDIGLHITAKRFEVVKDMLGWEALGEPEKTRFEIVDLVLDKARQQNLKG